MAGESITTLIDQQKWLDPIGDRLQTAIQNAYTAGGPAGQQVKQILSGTWLGHPLHPTLTDVPVGAWTVTALLDGIEAATGRSEYAPGADAALVLGLAGAVGAAVSGLSDWNWTVDRQRRIGLTHGLLNIGATVLYGASLVCRLRGARGWGRGLALVGYGMAGFSAWLGGDLSFGQRLGMDHAPEASPSDFVPVLNENDLPEGQPRRVEAEGIAVMLVRQGGRIYALADSCSHLGGPLSEGQLEDGCIICPWHASRFALADGRVLDAPATFPQPCYQTRVRNGKIEVGGPRSDATAATTTLTGQQNSVTGTQSVAGARS